jgi:arabinose-5-phosphate isomerase
MSPNHIPEIMNARAVLETESAAIKLAAERLDANFVRAVDILDVPDGKIVVAGLGKSGHVGRKIAATFCSTGSPAVFMHAAEAVHGDLGVHQSGNPTIFLSNSGSTSELLALVPILRDRSSSLVGILGNLDGALGQKMDVILDASVSREADPLGMVPTASFVVTAALGDALASSLMQKRGFSEEDYAHTHPGGQLGRSWSLSVNDLMHPMEKVACCEEDTSLRNLVIAMTEYPLGAACVMCDGRLLGLITDGDLRRALREQEDILSLKASALMSTDPVVVEPVVSIGAALRIMEERPSQIAVLPVVSPEDGSLLGLLRLHDIYTPDER